MTEPAQNLQEQPQVQPANQFPPAAATASQEHPAAGLPLPGPGKPRAKPYLSAIGLSVAEYKRHQWWCEAAEGVTVEDTLNAEYWAHVSAKMTPFDRIEVVAVDGTWAADLLVLATGRTAAKVKLLHHYTLDGGYSDMSAVNQTHTVKHRGPRKWSIIRVADGAIIKEDIPTREDAEAAKLDYLKALGM